MSSIRRKKNLLASKVHSSIRDVIPDLPESSQLRKRVLLAAKLGKAALYDEVKTDVESNSSTPDSSTVDSSHQRDVDEQQHEDEELIDIDFYAGHANIFPTKQSFPKSCMKVKTVRESIESTCAKNDTNNNNKSTSSMKKSSKKLRSSSSSSSNKSKNGSKNSSSSNNGSSSKKERRRKHSIDPPARTGSDSHIEPVKETTPSDEEREELAGYEITANLSHNSFLTSSPSDLRVIEILESNEKRRKLDFDDNLYIYEFPYIMDNNPSVTNGIAVALAWDCHCSFVATPSTLHQLKNSDSNHLAHEFGLARWRLEDMPDDDLDTVNACNRALRAKRLSAAYRKHVLIRQGYSLNSIEKAIAQALYDKFAQKAEAIIAEDNENINRELQQQKLVDKKSPLLSRLRSHWRQKKQAKKDKKRCKKLIKKQQEIGTLDML